MQITTHFSVFLWEAEAGMQNHNFPLHFLILPLQVLGTHKTSSCALKLNSFHMTKKRTSKTGLQRPAARYDGIGKIGGGYGKACCRACCRACLVGVVGLAGLVWVVGMKNKLEGYGHIVVR